MDKNMFGKLLPKSTNFFDFFERHAAFAVQSTKMFLSLVTEETEDAPAKATQIKQLEHEADNNARKCIEALHKIFITPFEREDIYRLMVRMDDIIDFVESASERLLVYRLREMTSEVKEMARLLFLATQELELAIKGLRTSESADAMRKHFLAINKLENEGDEVLRNAVGRLFDEVQDTRTVIKWKEIYEILENAIDRCEDVANIIEGVILERD